MTAQTNHRPGPLLAALTPCLILLAAAWVEPNFGYNRWDNFEYCTPVIWAAHSQWLRGTVPYWNPHQHLGEPFTSLMLAGTFYVPYTLCCLVVRLCGWGPSALALVIVVLHTAFAALGWYRLLELFGVRPEARWLASTSASLGGFVTCMSAVWIFVAPVCAWLPWLLCAVVRVVEEPRRPGPFLLLVAGLAAVVCVGHLQLAVYSWLFAGIFAAGYAVLVAGRTGRLAVVVAAAVIAGLVAAPFWLPSYLYFKATSGPAVLHRAEFLARSASPLVVVDVLLPVYSYINRFMPDWGSIYAHQGSWVAAAILAGLAVMWRQRRGGAPADRLLRAFLLGLGCAAVFYILSIGEKGRLLGLTYGAPLWSSFRYPFKFLAFFLAALAFAAGLGVEICWREAGGARWRKAAGFGLAVFAMLLLAGDLLLVGRIMPPLKVWSGVLCLVAGMAVMPALLLGRRVAARRLALAAGLLQALGLVSLCHHQALKRYQAPYGAVGPAQLGIDNRYRVMPLSSFQFTPAVAMEEYALFHSATANGYFSASGHHTRYLLPRWYERWLPVNEVGLLPARLDRPLVASNLLRSFNVRYYIVSKPDHLNRDSVAAKGLHRIRELRETEVYEDLHALPRAYFATAVHPYDDRDIQQALIQDREPSATAFVEGWWHARAMEPAEVLEADWDRHIIRATVRAPQGGFLVVSTTWYPGWRAWVDGRLAPLYRVNGVVLGLMVPAGGSRVELRFAPSGWRISLALAAIGMVLLAAAVAKLRRANLPSVNR